MICSNCGISVQRPDDHYKWSAGINCYHWSCPPSVLFTGQQEADSTRWEGWDWRKYQQAIVRGNYAISDLERKCGDLVEACKIMVKVFNVRSASAIDPMQAFIAIEKARTAIEKADSKKT